MPNEFPKKSAEISSREVGNAGVLRILDAEADRAAEGLRVIEDYVRFILNDRHLTGVAKHLRHQLTAALRPIATKHRLAARDSETDVGAALAPPAGAADRSDAADVAAASFQRLQQALRSLEEYGKLVDPAMAAEVERLRFASYTLERAVGLTADALERLADARLYVLIDGCDSEHQLTALASSLVMEGVHLLQLRDKRLADRELLARARCLRAATRHSSTLFIMNDRPDLAVLSGADGVHVGQVELSVNEARTVVGPNALIGVSTHSVDQARQAVSDGANYIGVGPTFASTTKSFDAFTGLELLRTVATEISLPAFAIGGITLENLPQVQATGIRRVAISSAVTKALAPGTSAREFLARLNPRIGARDR